MASDSDRTITSKRSDLIGVIKRGGPHHDPPFTIERVGIGEYRIVPLNPADAATLDEQLGRKL